MPQPLALQAVHHLAVQVRETARSVAFYRDVLGFRELQRPGFDFSGAWLAGAGVQIHIIEQPHAEGERTDFIDSRTNHFAFAMADTSDVPRMLDEHGIAYHQRVNAGGIHQTFFQDPDGNHIEVAVYPANNPPFLT